MTFTAQYPDPPEMSLKARLAWEYFFGSCCGGWAVAHTADDAWIITDEACSLDTAMVYPDEASFIDWLESVAQEHISENRLEWFRSFAKVPELVDDNVALCMEKIVSA